VPFIQDWGINVELLMDTVIYFSAVLFIHDEIALKIIIIISALNKPFKGVTDAV